MVNLGAAKRVRSYCPTSETNHATAVKQRKHHDIEITLDASLRK